MLQAKAEVVEFFGKPEYQLTWSEITQKGGIPTDLYDKTGAYAVFKGGLQYIGQSTVLGRRLGQLVGAICGGTHLHPGGYRIFEAWDDLPDQELVVLIWVGDSAYDAEPEAIWRMQPPMNRAGRS